MHMRKYGQAPRVNNARNALRVSNAFRRDQLATVCAMHETEFESAYGMDKRKVDQTAPADFYLHQDNGSNVLAVAHLDTVGLHNEREAHFVETECAGDVVFSRALDDRLGAYIILHLLPALGIRHDILLTVGEESGQSTAGHYSPDKDYDYLIEFDRGGTDVVMYQYEDSDMCELVESCGARVGDGIFSDISYMESLGIKGFNWGTGYRDYHGPRAHAYLDDTFDMVAQYLRFHKQNARTYMPHESARLSNDDWWLAHEDSRYPDNETRIDTRHWTDKDWAKYLDRIDSPGNPL
jgi:hypothetical protein